MSNRNAGGSILIFATGRVARAPPLLCPLRATVVRASNLEYDVSLLLSSLHITYPLSHHHPASPKDLRLLYTMSILTNYEYRRYDASLPGAPPGESTTLFVKGCLNDCIEAPDWMSSLRARVTVFEGGHRLFLETFVPSRTACPRPSASARWTLPQSTDPDASTEIIVRQTCTRTCCES